MKKFNSNKELCSKTLNVGDEFMRERISYGYMSSNQYFICKIIEKNGAKKDVQYVLYVGTNDKDTNRPVFSHEESMEKAKEILLEKEIEILVALNDGDFSSTAWGCDLTYDYVKINGDYRT